MANAIDLVVAQQALDQLKNLIAQLDLVDAKMTAISANAITLSANAGKVTTPSAGSTNAGSNAGANNELSQAAALNKKLAASIALLQAKYTELTKATATGTKTLLEEQAAIREKLRLATLVAKGVNAEVSAYQKLDAEYKKSVLVAKELGAVHGSNSGIFIKEAAQVNKLADELKAIDGRLGNHTRSVGNYASGWNGLSNSINQLTREAPAFANSMQTGFMALSNNIPIFVDELESVRQKNISLAASGEQTDSVFKTVAKSFFSWQTALSVGVTLLTIYGAKLIDMAFNTDGAKKATENLTKALKDNQTQVDKNIAQLEHQATIEIELAKQRGASEGELASIKAKLGVDVLTENEKNNAKVRGQIDGFDRYRLLQLKGGNAALLFLIKKYNGDVVKARTELQRREKAYTDENRKLLVEEQERTYDLIKKQNEDNTELDAANNTAEAERSRQAFEEMSADQQKAEEERLALLAEMHRKEIELQLTKIDVLLNDSSLYYTDRLHQLDLDFIKRSELEKLNVKEELRLAGGSYEAQQIALLNSNIKKIELLEDYNKNKTKLEKLALQPVTQLATSELEIKDPAKILADNAKRGLKGLKGSTDKIQETWKNTFDNIANAARQSGEIMAGFSEANFRNEFSRLEAQKDISLKFAGESAFAKQQIEDQYNTRRKEIEVRENKAKQKQAIFNIAIDTAQAVIASLKKTGFAGIPLSVIVGALGAAQIAVVASQKIPQYFEGGVHDGGMMMVNDAKGSSYKETIVTPDGKIIKPEGRNVLMNAPKGTQIFTPEQWQEKELHNMLQSKGVSMNESHYNNSGLTYQEMDAILGKHFKNITTQTTTFDKKGFTSYSVSKGNKTIRNENRASGKGFKV